MTFSTTLTTKVLAVDFAARFSAAVVRDSGGAVLAQFDSFGATSFEFCGMLADAAVDHDVKYAVFEDVPHGVNRLFMVKAVLRLQGAVMNEFYKVNMLDRLWWLDPATWQRTFEGVWKGGAEGARVAAERLGYVGPDLLTEYEHMLPLKGPERTKMRAQLKKATTDYPDAFLISEWALNQEDLLNAKGIQPPMF